MSCPPEIAAVILEILYSGLLAARAAGWSGDATRAAIEADHLHNLPHLLSDFKWELVEYYWEIERPSYMDRVSEKARYFEPMWQKLAVLVEDQRRKSSASQSG